MAEWSRALRARVGGAASSTVPTLIDNARDHCIIGSQSFRPNAGPRELASAMSFVVIDNLKKYFGNVLASNIEHLEVHQGEFVSFLGPSGCGKTTTLRCIAGIIEPDAGLISIRGRDITRTPPYERNLGMVFQNYALFPHMTVFDNVAYGLRNYRKLAKKEIGDKVAQVLELVELPGFEGRFPHQLSGGQQQRIALARAVVYDPDVLLRAVSSG